MEENNKSYIHAECDDKGLNFSVYGAIEDVSVMTTEIACYFINSIADRAKANKESVLKSFVEHVENRLKRMEEDNQEAKNEL